jgi:hypothetical protein
MHSVIPKDMLNRFTLKSDPHQLERRDHNVDAQVPRWRSRADRSNSSEADELVGVTENFFVV